MNRDSVSLAELIGLDNEAKGGIPDGRFVQLAPMIAEVTRAHQSLSIATFLKSKADQGFNYLSVCLKAVSRGRVGEIDQYASS